MRDFYFENKGTKIYCTAWDDASQPIGVVLLAHDMGEYAARYDDFATFLGANGYIVVSLDLRAHGRTCGGYDHRGETDGDCFADSVDDLYKLGCYALSQYRLPLMAMGFGYGALLAQCLLQQYGEKFSAAALVGTTKVEGLFAMASVATVSTEIGFVDGHTAGQLFSKLILPRYEKYFAEEKTRYAWLTRDKEAVKQYVADPYCGAQFTFCMYFEQSLFKWLLRIGTRKRMLEIPADMPLWLASGDKDPVGGQGKNVLRLYNALRQSGHNNIALQFYAGARHALLWETNRDDVYMDILRFLQKTLT